MAFARSTMAMASGHQNGNIPRVWTYTSTDTAATVNTASYFDDMVNELNVGDFIMAYLDTGGTPQGYIFCVNSNDGTNVDVTDGLAIGTTDSD